MKTLLLLLSFGLAARLVTAQVVRPALDEDPVFRQVLTKRLHYPGALEFFPIYGRVYAGFHIDQKGKMTNIIILSPGNTRSGFDYEVLQTLRHMPSLNPRYEGDYALPVAFRYINRTVSDSLYSPINRLDERHIGNRLVLQELTRTLDFRPAKGRFGEPREVWGYYAKK